MEQIQYFDVIITVLTEVNLQTKYFYEVLHVYLFFFFFCLILICIKYFLYFIYPSFLMFVFSCSLSTFYFHFFQQNLQQYFEYFITNCRVCFLLFWVCIIFLYFFKQNKAYFFDCCIIVFN